jgi:ABC-type phosphate transport system substrate-binding protein
MHRLKPRGLRAACALSVLAVTALVAPAIASATPGGEQCSGVNIEGKGASLQKLSQISVWTPKFSDPTDTNAAACSGTQGSKGTPTVKYTSTGSGPGLESWGQEPGGSAPPLNFGPKNAYVGTDEPPNAAQRAEIETHTGGGKVLTIPVEQSAVAVAMNLPAKCTKVSGGPAPGRIALKAVTVEKIFRGAVTVWKSILNGAKLEGEAGCSSSAKITRVVRLEGSGTTSLFKKWLGVVFAKEVEGTKTWKQLAEKANNTAWPVEGTDPVVRGEGNGGVATELSKTPGGVAYVNLADARKNKSFSPPLGGASKPMFWAPVENGKNAEKVTTYADPSTNGDEEATASSNCAETLYTNGKKKFPPPTTEETWNEVSAAKLQKHYPICGFTYDLSLTSFKGVPTGEKGSLEAPTEGAVRTAYDYLSFVLAGGAGGGQTIIGEATDYLGLPTTPENPTTDVLGIARKGTAKITF